MRKETVSKTEPKKREETITAETPPAETVPQETTGEEKKKRKIRITFENKLYDIIIAIENARKDPLIVQYMSEYNYNDERLQKGHALATDARDKYNAQKAAKADYMAKAHQARQKREKADATYMYHVKIVRLSFAKDNDILQKLDLKGKRRVDFGGWKAQVDLFYENVVQEPAVMEEFAKHSITTETLEAAKQEVIEAVTANGEIMSAKGDAEKATELKNKAFAKARAWWRNFIKIAHIALEEDVQMKEKIGIVAPSETFN